jgi:integrase
LNAALETEYYSLFYLMVYTGLRRGEALGTRWCDVNLDKATLTVRQTLQQLKNGDLIFKKPKSKKSRRQIALTPSSVIALWDHRIKQNHDRQILGKPLLPTDLVFSNPDGNPFRPGSITRVFKDIACSLSLYDISLHSLRHAHATILLKQGIHPKIVQERLGHSSISTTLDVYSHVVPGLQEAAAKRFDEGLPQTTLQDEYDILAKRLEIRVGKMSAILPFEPILG